MSLGKIAVLGVWVLFAALALCAPGTVWGTVGVWGLVLSVVIHGIEVALYYGRCKRAGGSLPRHLLNVFLFGVLHLRELPPQQGG